jgi:hypothetical protein
MDQETFEETLCSFLRREPFEPFIVEMEDGERIVVEEPTVAFNGRVAGYLNPSFEIQTFQAEQVLQLRRLPWSTAF